MKLEVELKEKAGDKFLALMSIACSGLNGAISVIMYGILHGDDKDSRFYDREISSGQIIWGRIFSGFFVVCLIIFMLSESCSPIINVNDISYLIFLIFLSFFAGPVMRFGWVVLPWLTYIGGLFLMIAIIYTDKEAVEFGEVIAGSGIILIITGFIVRFLLFVYMMGNKLFKNFRSLVIFLALALIFPLIGIALDLNKLKSDSS